MLKLLRRLLFLGLLAAALYAVWKKLAGTDGDDPVGLGFPAQPAPFPPAPKVPPAPSISPAVPAPAASVVGTPTETAPPPEAAASASWVEPDDGACPLSHPVKGKLTSGIFHVPGGQNYDRTRADRCYADSATAEADGLRQAKR